MSSIQSQSLSAGLSPRQSALSDSQFSSYVRKQSYSAYESLDAGVTIKTKEGDVVTLTSNSHSELNAFMYNSKGVLQTDSGKAMVTQNQREITLTSGESFTFSVVGDLSGEELGDIEAIVKDIDGIISKMADGNMEDAVDKAVSMGGYDTVSSYSADITYEKSYQMTSEIQAKTEKISPEPELLPKEENPVSSEIKPFPENRSPRKKRNNSIKNIDQFVEKMAEKLEKYDEKLVDKAQKPIDKLFSHKLKQMREQNREDRSTETAVENVRSQIEKMIEKMTGNIFKDQLSAFLE